MNPVARLTPEERERRLDMSFQHWDRVLRDPDQPHHWYVRGNTSPRWYLVIDGRMCQCRGYKRDGICRHLVRVSYESHQAKREYQS